LNRRLKKKNEIPKTEIATQEKKKWLNEPPQGGLIVKRKSRKK
jgi:hypothetical protein